MRPRLARATLPWSGFAAIGAYHLVAALGFGVAWTLFGARIIVQQGPPRFEAVLFPAALVGAAVAIRIGGPRALATFLAYVAVLAALPFVRALRGHAECLTALSSCALDLDFVVAQWPLVPGLVAGIAVARAIPTVARGANAVLEGAGVHALGGLAAALWFLAADLLAPADRLWRLEYDVGWIALVYAGASLAGLLMAVRAKRPAAAALVVAFVLVAGWTPLGVQQFRMAASEGLFDLLRFLTTPLSALALMLVALMASRAGLRAPPVAS